MRHSLQAEGEAFRLRPVSVDDAAFIVALRTDPVLGKYLHATSPDIDDQRAWTKRYYEREGDWYFVVEQRATSDPQGAVAIYNYDADQKIAEWGRWILKKGSLAALESAALIYDVGFDQLGLELMYSRTANKLVVSFDTRLGSTTEGLVIGPEGERLIETRMTSAQWHELRAGLQEKIAAVAAIVNR